MNIFLQICRFCHHHEILVSKDENLLSVCRVVTEFCVAKKQNKENEGQLTSRSRPSLQIEQNFSC